MGGTLTHRLGLNPAAAAGVGDPYWDYVTWLTHGDSSDGTTTATDYSQIAHTLQLAGNCQQDTGIDVEGTSFLFDGSGDYITPNSTVGLTFPPATDFCVEAYIRPAEAKLQCLFGSRELTGERGIMFSLLADGALRLRTYASNGSTAGEALTTTGLVSNNTVYHVAATREGTTLRIFLDGVEKDSGTETLTAASATERLRFGRTLTGGSNDYHGSANWIRVTSGHCRYNAGFTPPTTPFPQG